MANANQGNRILGEHKVDLMRERAILNPQSYIRFWDDFHNWDAGASWALAGTGAGTAVNRDALGGWASLVTGNSDNNEVYASSIGEDFIFDTTRHVYFALKCNVASTSTTGVSSFCAGLSSVAAADTIVDGGGTVVTTFDGCLFLKPEGTTEDDDWIVTVSNAATQTIDTTSFVGDFTEASDHTIEFFYHPNDGTTGKIVPIVDGKMADAIDITISGLEEMHVVMGAKAHEGVAQVNSFVDWVEVIQER